MNYQELVNDSFSEIDDSWRSIAHVEDVPCGTGTYGLMIYVSPRETEECCELLRRVGRDAAMKFNEVFWTEVGRYGGPSALSDAIALNSCGKLTQSVEHLEVRVAFLHGMRTPHVEQIPHESEVQKLKIAFDFGVSVRRRGRPESHATDETIRALATKLDKWKPSA